MFTSNSLFIILLSSILIMGTDVSFAQSPSGQITIDVAVLSASGDTVTGLVKDDFLLYENGRQQEILSLEAVDLSYRILMIDECTGDPGNRRVANAMLWDRREIPFQTALISFLDKLAGHGRVAMAQFGKNLTMLRGWNASPAMGPTIQLRSLSDSFGPDCCVNSNGAMEHSFLEKLSWIESELEGVRGRKAVVWFGPPRNLPGNLVPDPTLTLKARGERSPLPNIEDSPEFRTVKERLRRTGASLYFVLSSREFNFAFQGAGERKRLFYVALQHWAETTGGHLLLADRPADVEALAHRLNREPGTAYTLSCHPPSPAATRDRQIEVRTRNPQLRVLQSRNTYFR